MSALRALVRRAMSSDIRTWRRMGSPTASRPDAQGGGKYTKPAPKARRARSRRANAQAKASRRANRR